MTASPLVGGARDAPPKGNDVESVIAERTTARSSSLTSEIPVVYEFVPLPGGLFLAGVGHRKARFGVPSDHSLRETIRSHGRWAWSQRVGAQLSRGIPTRLQPCLRLLRGGRSRRSEGADLPARDSCLRAPHHQRCRPTVRFGLESRTRDAMPVDHAPRRSLDSRGTSWNMEQVRAWCSRPGPDERPR